jgi:phospholipase D
MRLFIAVAFLSIALPCQSAAEPINCNTTIHFSPDRGVAASLIAQIDSAEKEIRIALYGLNNPQIGGALIAARQRGVLVFVLLDHLQSSGKGQKAQIARLKAEDVTVQVSRLSRLLHDKYAVIDRKKVWTGSYNWTVDAETRHRENAVLLDCPAAAELYQAEWERILRDG